MIQLTEEELKELLAKSYDAGWYGVRELRDSAVQTILSQFLQNSQSIGTMGCVSLSPTVEVNWAASSMSRSGSWFYDTFRGSQ